MKLTTFTFFFLFTFSVTGFAFQQKTDKPLQKRELKTTEKRQIKSVNAAPGKKKVLHVKQAPVQPKAQYLHTESK